MKNYSVYVIKSEKNGKRYIGMTVKDIKERLKEHNSGSNKFTRNNKPFNVLYYEKGYCKPCAIIRERFLKSGRGRKLLDIIENYLD